MEPNHLKVLRRAAEAAADEAHRVEGLFRSYYDRAAIEAAIKSARVAERRASGAYRRAYNARLATNERLLRAV